jgi:hypothetical protein
VGLAALTALLAPAAAHAQFFPVQEEAPPGITITGAGLASVKAPGRLSEGSIDRAVDAAYSTATRRAARAARRRAAAIAAAAGVTLGQTTKLELQDAFSQFGVARSRCRRPRGGRRVRCRVPPFAAAAATVTFSIAGGADESEDAPQVEAYGSAFAPVEPSNPRRNQSIRRAVLAARTAVTPAAAAAARRNVATAARSAGLTLGAPVSISEPREPYFYEPALGSFGPGLFCGVVRRPVFGTDPETGRRRIVRRIRKRRCYFPRPLSLRLEATYQAR